MRQYEMFELEMAGPEPEGSRAVVDLVAEFVCEGESKRVSGFYAGNGIYKIRFYPSGAGLYRWKVTGVVTGEGQEMCQAAGCSTDVQEGCGMSAGALEGSGICGAAAHPAGEQSRNVSHGMVKVKGLHFQYEDGTWYYPFGTTVYALVHQEKELVDTTMETLRASSFNKVRFCVFPKHYDFNHNEPEVFPFEKTEGRWDVHRPVAAYWEALESRIRELDRMGIQGDLILFHPYDRWGFAEFTRQESLVYLDYLLRRLSAMPNLWWSMANEYDLMSNYKWEDWEEMIQFVAAHDPYGHCLSNHNCMAYWNFAQKEITHCCIQDVNVSEVPELQEKYGKPVIFDECRYEGNISHIWGNISARELVRRFWTAVCSGGYCTHGETFYSEDEVLWWARGGVLKGESPARIAFLRELVESLPQPLEYRGEGWGARTAKQLLDWKEKGLPGEIRQNFFAMTMLNLSPEDLRSFVARERVALACCGDRVFLKYLGRQCAARTEIDLPREGAYRMEVIDAWEMTRKVALENACGRVQIELPGREDMAILAIRVEK